MKLTLTSIFLLITLNVFSQTAYYEATELRRILGDISSYAYPPSGFCAANPQSQRCVDYERMLSILRKYAPDAIKNGTVDVLIAHYQTNPFFARLPNTPTASSAALGTSIATGLSQAVGSIGNFNVTNFADGLAQFLVERTKEELNVAFFQKLQRLLETYPELNVVFPNTQVFLSSFESWQYASLLNTLREAFDKDFKEILSNLIELRNLDPSSCPSRSDECRTRVTEIQAFLRSNNGRLMLSALQLGNGLQQGQKLPDVLNSIATDDFLLGYTNPDPVIQQNFRNSVKLTNILSLSLRSNLVTRHYITKTEFDLLTSDPDLQRIFLGLIYEQVATEGIVIGNLNVATVLGRANNLLTYLRQVHDESVRLQAIVEDMKIKKASGKLISEDYGALFESANILFKTIINVEVIDPSLHIPADQQRIFDLIPPILAIAHDLSIKNYNAAIVGILKLLDDFTKENRASYQHLPEFSSSFLNYASFGANVVSAKTPEEVKQAIKSIAQPSGSSSIKKNTNFNVALGAYVGFVYGKDVPTKNEYTVTDENGLTTKVRLNGGRALAVYAPVGVTFSKGMLFSERNPWSVSAFVSVIDIGALVGYRFTNDSTSTVSTEVKLANIFAPGLNISIGLPSVPISIGYGFQWIPSLQRNPGDNELYKVDYSGMRYHQIFIAVDIPLINFHSGKKRMLSRRRN